MYVNIVYIINIYLKTKINIASVAYISTEFYNYIFTHHLHCNLIILIPFKTFYSLLN